MEQNNSDFDVLSARYDVGFSQQIADSLKSRNQREIGLLDIKHLDELTKEYRHRIRELARRCRASGDAGKADGPLMGRVYASHEAIFTRRQIADLWTLYRMAQADRSEMAGDFTRRKSEHRFRPSPPPQIKSRSAA